MKKILIIATGGTIAGTGNAGKTAQYKCAEIDVDSLLETVPHAHNEAEISGVQILNVASGDIKLNDLAYIAEKINEFAENEEYDGFVITHGTDTLEETAYFLNLTVKTKKPVVITGAMRPSTATSADGPQNLYQSIVVATKNEAYGMGVLVVFADTIYSAREVTKVSTQATVGFGGRDFGALGYIHDDYVEMVHKPMKIHTFNSEFNVCRDLKNIPIIYFHIEADAELIEYQLKKYDAIIIAGAGNGCFSTEWEQILAKDEYREKIIVLTSRVANGAVVKPENSPKTWISGGTLNPQKSRILLQFALCNTSNPVKLQEFFEKY